MDTGELMYAKQEKQIRQCASLTKIMTFLAVHQILEKNRLESDKIRIKILTTSTSQILGGTSAQLLAHDKVSVSELFYGMMLPSGNDAA